MKRVVSVALLAVALAPALTACAAGPRGRGGPPMRDAANPGQVVATELAFARTAREKGQWTAFADYAAKDAVMFVPQPVHAREWLKTQSNPAQSVAWQPHKVWSSCDGTLSVTMGAWQRPDGSTGYFTTVWQRSAKGEYNWVMDQGDQLAQPLEMPEMISAKVADCNSPAPAAAVPAPAPSSQGTTHYEGTSRDRTLLWQVDIDPATFARSVKVMIWQNGAMVSVVDEKVSGGN